MISINAIDHLNLSVADLDASIDFYGSVFGLEIAEDQRDDAERQERELALTRKFDAANEEKVLVGDQFNKQVRAYNAKRQQTKEE